MDNLSQPASVEQSLGKGMKKKIRFMPINEFGKELRQRVSSYFTDNRLSKHDSTYMYIKASIIFAWFIASYVLLVFMPMPVALKILCAISLGLSIDAIGFNVVHDAAHHAFSTNRTLNNILAFSLDLIGGSSFYWKFKHNYLHHTYTNITGYDDDINVGFLARFSPFQKHRGFHKFQHIYMWLFYGFMIIRWQLFDDFVVLARGKMGGHKVARPKGFELFTFFLGKALFATIAFVIPMMLYSVTTVLLFYVLVTYVLGLTMAVVFQLAHCIEELDFPEEPVSTDLMDNTWIEHQVETTADFCRANSVVTWFVGGLNFQVEHHLFPTICHAHYPTLSKIVEGTCEEYDVRYVAQKSLGGAIGSHYRWLYNLGQGEGAAA